jgi:hypothetical protein
MGIALTAILAIVLKKWWRWAAMLVVPLVTYMLCSHFGKAFATDGNLLYVAISMLYLVVLAVYYPVLTILAAFLWLKRNDRKEGLP